MRKIKIKYGEDGHITARCPYCKYICKLTKEENVDVCDHLLYVREYALFTKEGVGLSKKPYQEPYQERKQECDEVDQEKSDDTFKEWQRGFFGYASYMTIKYHK